MLWQFQMGEGGHHLSVSCQMSVSNGFSLMVWIHTELDCFHWQFHVGGRTSPVTFSSNDCFEWVLTDGMETRSCHFFMKQFQMRGRGGEGEDIDQSRFVCQI